MPAFEFTSPDGKKYIVNGPEGSTPQQAYQFLQQQIGAGQIKAETPGIGSQLLSAPKEFVKSTTSGLVQAFGGLGALPYAGARYFMPELKPFERTGFGQAITGAERYLAPSDEGVVTQLVRGLGSLASILGPQIALRGLGAAGRFAGMAPRAAAPVAVAQTAGLGAEEARQRVEIARGEGKTVTPGEELAALSVGAAIGLTELPPVAKLFRGLDKTLSGAVKLDIANYIKRGLAQGGIEGAQEAASGLLQDLSAKGIYNPNLEIGQSILGDAALGGGVGFIAQTGLDFLLRKDIGRAYQAKLSQDRQTELDERLDVLDRGMKEQLETTRRNFGVSNLLALPAPPPQVAKEETRDPLMNPVGFFNAEELTPANLKAVNNIRKTEGKRGIKQFSIEDLADAGAPQAEIDRLLAFRTGYDGKTALSADDVMNLAAKKNVDTSIVGFMDFLRRATGSEDVTTMSQPQLFSAFKALDGLTPSDKVQVLPPGTNATRFSDDQYNKSLIGLGLAFPKNNMMSRKEAIQNIKTVSGLESDRDAESLLQTAIRNGDLTTINRKVFEVGIPGDMTAPAVRRYLSREAAENAAARLGLEVRERTHQDVAITGTAAQLPGGPDIRKGTFKQGVAPAGYQILDVDGKKIGLTYTSKEAADQAADNLSAYRNQEAQKYITKAKNLQKKIDANTATLQKMQALGDVNSLEYSKASANIFVKNKKLEEEKNAALAEAKKLGQPLKIAPKGEKPITRDGFTLFEQNQPVATFPNQQAAEEAAIARLPDETLQNIVKLAPSQKGLMPKRLGKMAETELRRRSGEQPAGFGVEFTGDKAAAEARLAEAGVFTREFQKAADQLLKKLRPMMERLGLGDMRLNILRAIKTKDGQTADGYYLQKVIAIAMDAKNPIRSLRHEVIHALKELGAFTPQQWKVLENKAKSEWMSKYDIANRYRGMGMSQADMIEEAIADAFSDFDQTKAPPGLIGALFNKIRQFLDAFGNGLRGMGFESAEGIFTRLETRGTQPAAPTRVAAGDATPERRVAEVAPERTGETVEVSSSTQNDSRREPFISQPIVRPLPDEKYKNLLRYEPLAVRGEVADETGRRYALLQHASRADFDKLQESQLGVFTFGYGAYSSVTKGLDKKQIGKRDVTETSQVYGKPYSFSDSGKGYIYLADMPMSKENTLILDKPLTEQPAMLQKFIEAGIVEPSVEGQASETIRFTPYYGGKSIYNLMPASTILHEMQERYAQDMLESGYPLTGLMGEERPRGSTYRDPWGLQKRVASELDRMGIEVSVVHILPILSRGMNETYAIVHNPQRFNERLVGKYEMDNKGNIKTVSGRPVQEQSLIDKIKDLLPPFRKKARGDAFQVRYEDLPDRAEKYSVKLASPEVIEDKGAPQPVQFMPNYRGTRAEVAAKPEAETVQIGDRKYALRQTDTPEFKKWFGKSTVMNKEGKPKVMYHGTARDITEFRPKQANAIFVTNNPEFALDFSYMSESWMKDQVQDNADKFFTPEQIAEYTRLGNEIAARKGTDPSDELTQLLRDNLPSRANIMPLFVRAENPFDYANPDHIKKLTVEFDKKSMSPAELYEAYDDLAEYLRESGTGLTVEQMAAQIVRLTLERIRYGSWTSIESSYVQDAIKSAGFDGFYVLEGGRKNLAVYEPNQVKSAIGNIGTFSRDSNDIRYALALQGLKPDSALVPNEGGNPDGNLGVMPERLSGKPIRMLIGTHDDITDKGYGANHILNRVLNDPKRIPGGAEELLEKIVRTAQRTAQNYNSIYRDGGKFVLYDGKNSLVLSPEKGEMSIITMFTQENPQKRYGAPVWNGRAPRVSEFLQPVRGAEVVEREGRVARKEVPVQTKRVYTPAEIKDVETQTVETPSTAGTLPLKKDAFRYSLRDSLDQDTVDAVERTTTKREEKGFAQRMGEALSPTGFTKFRQEMVNGVDSIENLSKAVGRVFGSRELFADKSAIAAALFADRAAGVAAASFQYGIPVYKDGFTRVVELSDENGSAMGLIPILEPLMRKYKDPFIFQLFQYYAAVRRARRFMQEVDPKTGEVGAREKVFGEDDIPRAKRLGKKYSEFEPVYERWQKFNAGYVQYMKDTGVISEEDAKKWTENWDYLPFFRQMEGEKTAGPSIFSSFSGVRKPRTLKGGVAPLADFMETVIRNCRAAIEAGMRNEAARRTVRDVVRMGQGRFVPAASAHNKDIIANIVTVLENGQPKHYYVDDPLLVEALTGLNLPELPWLDILSKPAHLLRNMVTREPGYMLANLTRDSVQAWITTGTDITPIVDSYKQAARVLAGQSKEAKALAMAGLFSGYDFAGDAKASARKVEAELRERTGQRTIGEKVLLPISKIWDALGKASDVSDVATRVEVYKRTLEETGNEAEALYQAMEVMNFGRKGNSALIRIVTGMIPFINARIQSMDVLYRAGVGEVASRNKERRQKVFITRSLYLLALSAYYWFLVSDSEEYKELTDEERDNYWIIPFIKSNDKALRIPIPFEIGTLFKVFPERILEYFWGQDTSKDLKDAVIRNLTSSLTFNPIPQAVLPIHEVRRNYSYFTGQPIVGRGLEDVAAEYQVSAGTSLLAQKVGKTIGYSPIKIDHLIRGYTGLLGTYSAMAIDAIMRDEGDPTKASLRFEQMPFVKRFFTEGTGTIDKYFEMKKAVDESVRTINFLGHTNMEDLREYMVDKGAKLQAVEPYIRALDKDMKMLREMRGEVLRSNMDPDQKRNVLNNIRKAEVALTSRIQFVKQSID